MEDSSLFDFSIVLLPPYNDDFKFVFYAFLYLLTCKKSSCKTPKMRRGVIPLLVAVAITVPLMVTIHRSFSPYPASDPYT